MKLIECYIENFGKLSHFSYTFSSGMNGFCKENGWGKTTFASFIKAMLYGLPSTRSKNLFENERSRYLPWQGGRFGGWMTFEAGGKTYRVERSFGAKESEDTFLLFDCATNTLSTDFAGGVLGEILFGIDQKGFERSTFISEKSEYVTPDFSEVQKKLVNVQDFEDQKEALKYLKERKKFYQPTRTRGEIVDLQNAEYRLLDEIREAEKAAKEYGRLEEAVSLTKTEQKQNYREIEKLRLHLEKITESRRIEDHINHTKTLTATAKAATEERKNAEAKPLPSLEEIGEITRAVKRLEAPRPSLPPTPAAEKKKAFSLPLLLLVFGVLLLGLILINPWLCLIGLGVIGASVLLLIIGKKETKSEAEAPRATEEPADENRAAVEEFLAKYPIENTPSPSLSQVSEWVQILTKKRDELVALREKERQAHEALYAYQDAHPLPAERMLPVSEEAEQELRERVKVLEAAYRDGVDRVMAQEREAARYANIAERLPELRQKLAETTEAMATAKQNLEVILATMEYLEEAKNELTASYLDAVQEKFSHYIGQMSKIDPVLASATYKLSPSFEVTVVENGASHEQIAVSRGTRDLLALCLQLALRDAIFENEEPPLLLDDPFIAFDEAHIGAALGCLKSIAETKQIIYFSCHESRI